MKTAFIEYLLHLPEQVAKAIGKPAGIPGRITQLFSRRQHIEVNERLLDRVRVGCLLLLIAMLSQASARLAWAIFTPPREVVSESVAADLDSRPRLVPGAADHADFGEKMAALHLFGQADAQAVAGAAMTEAPQTTLSLILKGLLLSTANRGSLAVIAEKGAKDGDMVYGVGELVPGNATIEAIFADRVVLRRGSQRETLPLEGWAEPGSEPPTEKTVPDTRISRQYVEKSLANLPELAKEVEVQIHNPEGRQPGFRLEAGQNSEFLSKLGLEPGDILYEINGIALTDGPAAMAAFEQLRDTRDFNLVFERNGEKQTTSIAIR